MSEVLPYLYPFSIYHHQHLPGLSSLKSKIFFLIISFNFVLIIISPMILWHDSSHRTIKGKRKGRKKDDTEKEKEEKKINIILL